MTITTITRPLTVESLTAALEASAHRPTHITMDRDTLSEFCRLFGKSYVDYKVAEHNNQMLTFYDVPVHESDIEGARFLAPE